MRNPRKGDLVTVRDLFPSSRKDIVRVNNFDTLMQWIEGSEIAPREEGNYVCCSYLCEITTLTVR